MEIIVSSSTSLPLTQAGMAAMYRERVAAGMLDASDPTFYVDPGCHPSECCLVQYRSGVLYVRCVRCLRLVVAVQVVA